MIFIIFMDEWRHMYRPIGGGYLSFIYARKMLPLRDQL